MRFPSKNRCETGSRSHFEACVKTSESYETKVGIIDMKRLGPNSRGPLVPRCDPWEIVLSAVRATQDGPYPCAIETEAPLEKVEFCHAEASECSKTSHVNQLLEEHQLLRGDLHRFTIDLHIYIYCILQLPHPLFALPSPSEAVLSILFPGAEISLLHHGRAAVQQRQGHAEAARGGAHPCGALRG